MEFEQGVVAEVRDKYAVLVSTAKKDRVTFYFDQRRAIEGVMAPSEFLNERKPVRDGDVKVGTVIVFIRRGSDQTHAARWETQEGYDNAKRRIEARFAKAKTVARQFSLPYI